MTNKRKGSEGKGLRGLSLPLRSKVRKRELKQFVSTKVPVISQG